MKTAVVLTICAIVLISPSISAQDTRAADSLPDESLEGRDTGGNSGTDSFTTIQMLKPSGGVDFFICNRSSVETISVAYTKMQGNDWMIVGWRNVEKGDCSLLVRSSNDVYYYAFGGRKVWSGNSTMCVDLKDGFSVGTWEKTCPKGFTAKKFQLVSAEARDVDGDKKYFLNLTD